MGISIWEANTILIQPLKAHDILNVCLQKDTQNNCLTPKGFLLFIVLSTKLCGIWFVIKQNMSTVKLCGLMALIYPPFEANKRDNYMILRLPIDHIL